MYPSKRPEEKALVEILAACICEIESATLDEIFEMALKRLRALRVS